MRMSSASALCSCFRDKFSRTADVVVVSDCNGTVYVSSYVGKLGWYCPLRSLLFIGPYQAGGLFVFYGSSINHVALLLGNCGLTLLLCVVNEGATEIQWNYVRDLITSHIILLFYTIISVVKVVWRSFVSQSRKDKVSCAWTHVVSDLRDGISE